MTWVERRRRAERGSLTVAVVGTGLMGTSIALAAGRAGDRVAGHDTDQGVLARATDRAGLEPHATLEDCVRGADLVVVCTPIPTIPDLAVRSLDAAPDAVVTDVGSVKAQVLSRVEVESSAPDRFVGGHPMGGSERTGPESASAVILDDAIWVLTPGRAASDAAVERVEAWVRRLGSRPMRMEPARHDKLVAVVSHLPQVASTALMDMAADEEAEEPELLLLAAGGFRDLTRLAASSPSLWRDILAANAQALGRAIDLYVDRLLGIRAAVGSGRTDELEEALARAKRARLLLSAKPGVRAGVALLLVPVPDRPGVLAELTRALGERAVNIEDLQIVHSPEGGRGTVHVTVAANDAEQAARALMESGFPSARLA
jgi:prephenate dehydrogenase